MNTQSPPASQKFIINLAKLDSTEPLEQDEWVNRKQLEDIKKKILEVVHFNTHLSSQNICYPYDDGLVPIAKNPCFFIHGERGSGKSTLLRELRKELLSPKQDPRIGLLANIDPCGFAEGESFFIYVLTRIAERLRINDIASYVDNDKNDIRKKALKILHDMSRGLKLLYDTNENLHKSEDATFFIEDSVNNCASSDKLKLKLHALLEELCRLEEVSCFLIAIDDADLQFNKCSEILETVRKYMLSPRLIIVFAGDLKLYSYIVRGTHLRHFDELSLKYDQPCLNHRLNMLDQLEEQYMFKLIPAYNRVYLTNFASILNFPYTRDVLISHPKLSKDSDTPISLFEYLSKVLLFLYPYFAVSNIRGILLRQPSRSILQLVKSWCDYLPQQSVDDHYNIVFMEKKETECAPIDYHKISEGLSDSIRVIMSQTIVRKRSENSDIYSIDTQELFKQILLHVADQKWNPSCSKLLSTVGNTNDKMLSIYLNAEAVRYMNSYGRILEYMLFVYSNIYYANARHRIMENPQWKPVDHRQLTESFINQIDYAIDMECDENESWYSAFLMDDRTDNTEPFCQHGIIQLANNHFDRLKPYINILNSTIKKEPSKENLEYSLAIYHSLCIVKKEDSTSCYLSIYSLLKLITDILHSVKQSIDQGTENYVELYTALGAKIPSVQIKHFPELKLTHTDLGDSSLYLQFEQILGSCYGFKNEVDEDIVNWAKEYIKFEGLCHPVYLDNAWTAFLQKCSEKELDKKENFRAREIRNLFIEYIELFTESLEENLREYQLGATLAECIRSFPLLKTFYKLSSNNTHR